MTDAPVLSFCIPVHNFGAFLPATLESILPQMHDALEIVVFDGGSTDNTPELMGDICARDPRVRYLRRDVRGGIDADLASCIDAARGEYCWLFSGDDTLQSGGVAYVLSALESGVDVHLLTHTDCTLDMQILRVHPALATIGPLRADLGQRDARRLWLTQALNTEALFSFASTLVVRRQTWNSMPARHDFDRSGWSHVARLLEIARNRLEVVYHPRPLVNRRGENDSFRDRGIVRRLALAVDGYERIAREFARDEWEAAQIRRLVRADLPVTVFIGAKAACRSDPERENRAQLDRLFVQCHGNAGPPGWWKLALYWGFPPFLEPPARRLLSWWRQRRRDDPSVTGTGRPGRMGSPGKGTHA